MRVVAVFLGVWAWFMALVCFAYAPTEAVSTMPVIAMRSEAELLAFLDLKKRNDYGAVWKFLGKNALILEKGTEVILTGSGCDGECVKFGIKGREEEFWAIPVVDGKKVFEYKKSE